MVTPHVTPLGALPSAHPQILAIAHLQLVSEPSVRPHTETAAGRYASAPRPNWPTLAA